MFDVDDRARTFRAIVCRRTEGEFDAHLADTLRVETSRHGRKLKVVGPLRSAADSFDRQLPGTVRKKAATNAFRLHGCACRFARRSRRVRTAALYERVHKFELRLLRLGWLNVVGQCRHRRHATSEGRDKYRR